MDDRQSRVSSEGVRAGRREYLALLFADLCGSSRLARKVDAELMDDLIGELRALAREEITRHGGQIVRLQGDGVLAVFGHGMPSELDGQRACEAALALHWRVSLLPPLPLADGPHRLNMHMGVHAGLVLVREGTIEEGRLELVGDAPNTAAWLCDLAGPGELVVDIDTLGPALHLFDLADERAMQVPGRERPMTVVQVRGRSALRRRFDATAHRGFSPFVGRWDELERLCATVLAVAGQPLPTLLVVRGEAGIGKTRFLQELAGQLDALGLVCLAGQADLDPGRQALQPLLELHRVLQRALEPAVRRPTPEALATTAEPAPTGWLPDALLQQLQVGLRALLPRRAALLLDDWQWADEASRLVLEGLLRTELPGLVAVVAMRPQAGLGDTPDATASGRRTHVDLAPFSAEQTGETVARWVPGADPFVVAELHEAAGGVPLLVEELCHMLRRGGVDALRASGGRATAPSWMAAMVATRLQALPGPLQDVVEVAAVLGGSMAVPLLAEVLPGGVDAAMLDALREADLLYPADPGHCRFKHALTRDAVYSLVPLQRRRALHRRVAEVLLERAGSVSLPDLDEALAHHTAAAELWAEAVGRCERAGDRALAQHAFDRARRLYRAAIDAAGRLDLAQPAAALHWCGLVGKLGMTCIFDPLALPGVLPLFERAEALARQHGTAADQARAAYWLGYINYGFGQPRRAVQCCRRAVAAAQAAGDARLLAQLEATLGQTLAAAGDYHEALQAMDAALQSKRRQTRGSMAAVATGSAFTLACRAAVLADRGDFGPAQEALDEAFALLGETLHPVSLSVRNWGMVILAWQGRWDETIAVVDDTERMAERARALLPLAIARAAGGYARWRRDADSRQVDRIADAVRWMEDRRCTFFTSIYHGWLAEACAELGRDGGVRRHAAGALWRARAGDALGEAAAWRALARQAATGGDAPRVARCLARADASAQRRGSRRDQALNDACRAAVGAAALTAPAASL
jgi:class 3 adenylate cyclase/tetratricopeptide (TPR) repeat protein